MKFLTSSNLKEIVLETYAAQAEQLDKFAEANLNRVDLNNNGNYADLSVDIRNIVGVGFEPDPCIRDWKKFCEYLQKMGNWGYVERNVGREMDSIYFYRKDNPNLEKVKSK